MGRKLSSRSIFVVAVLFCGLCTPLFADTYAEQEPNDTKYTGNVVPFPMVAGDTITGFTTGGFSFEGDSSADHYLVQTAVLPPGIYQHRLQITNGPPPATNQYSSSIRGLAQVNGVIQPNTDATAHFFSQNGSYPNHPGRTVQWYGFGRGERIYYRIGGNNSTSSNYTATLITTPVTPQVVNQVFLPGPITIANASTDMTTHFDAWVYDANLNAIPDYGPNFPTSLSRDFAAGIYYIALGKFDLSNNLLSPDGPAANPTDHQNSPVLDFPDAVVVAPSVYNYNIDVIINNFFAVDGDITGPPFNIVWLKLTVGDQSCVCLGDMDSNSLVDGMDMPAFVTSVLGGEGDCADTNDDTLVNSDDIPTFIDRLLSGDEC